MLKKWKLLPEKWKKCCQKSEKISAREAKKSGAKKSKKAALEKQKKNGYRKERPCKKKNITYRPIIL